MSAARRPRWFIGVVIPAQNEAASIERCLASVIAAHRHCGARARLWIVVVADACSDGTVPIARAALGRRGEVIECSFRSPGSARRLGAAAVIARFGKARPRRVWLANTDADTRVPADWLQRHLDHADDGASAVAGIVQLDAADGLREDLLRLYRTTYELPCDGRHGHVHGANLGVRVDAYLDAGGWSHETVAEDHSLWRRLRLRGWQLRSCVNSVVLTSARLHGRAVGGFADTLCRRLEAERG
jgi:cellulose synthase/poly-beta-1,6-N-acetylglucosamine synthase-like glycosyltransferase